MTLLFGLTALAAAIVVMVVARENAVHFKIAGFLCIPFWLAGFGGFIFGAFRLVLASNPEEMSRDKRMVLGVVFGCGGLVLLLVLVLATASLVLWLSAPAGGRGRGQNPRVEQPG